MINGYSIKDVNRYIYCDTIVLTVSGVIFGTILGTVIGNLSVFVFGKLSMYMKRGIVPVAVLAGTVGTGVFSFAACRIALRRIKGFQRADIFRLTGNAVFCQGGGLASHVMFESQRLCRWPSNILSPRPS